MQFSLKNTLLNGNIVKITLHLIGKGVEKCGHVTDYVTHIPSPIRHYCYYLSKSRSLATQILLVRSQNVITQSRKATNGH